MEGYQLDLFVREEDDLRHAHKVKVKVAAAIAAMWDAAILATLRPRASAAYCAFDGAPCKHLCAFADAGCRRWNEARDGSA